jgi:regulator of cell morphogenesis and NO signaling
MNELMTKTLAQIVNDNHHAAAIFEKYHLDFCCKGKRSLQNACAETNLQVNEVLNDLERITQSKSKEQIDFNKLSLTQLADYIVNTHHAYLKIEMPQIFNYLQRVASKHGSRHPQMVKVFELFTALKEEMEQHMQKEELILFPRIKQFENPEHSGTKLNITYLQSPINMMEEEHEHAGNLLEEIRQLTNNYNPPSDACTTYRLSFAALQAFEIDLHQHVHLENNILFPKALQLIQKTKDFSRN